jgi:hypothetical protein
MAATRNPMTTFPPASDDEFGQQLRRAVRALPDAPPALLRAAIGLWPAAAAPTPAALVRALLNRINAVLTFDSWAAPALAPGMRSLRSATRHLLFSAQGRDIDLRITPQAGGFGLTGQVLGPDDAGTVALARLDQPGAAVQQALLDELGEFRLTDLPAGSYQLSLLLRPDTIELPPLQLGEPPLEPGP